MASAGVRYLVSNSLTHPDNTPGNFKISYNEPFDMTGKKIALVNATLTKSAYNVFNEAMTVTFPPLKEKVLPARIITINSPENFRKHTNFIEEITTVFPDHNGELLFEIKTKLRDPYTCEYTTINHSNFDLLFIVSNYFKIVNFDSLRVKSKRGPIETNTNSQITIASKKEVMFELSINPTNRANVLFNDIPILAMEKKIDALLLAIVYSTNYINISSLSFKPGPGKFSSVNKLLDKLNTQLQGKQTGRFTMSKGIVSFEYDDEVKPNMIDLGGLEHYLGYDNCKITTGLYDRATNPKKIYMAQRPPDLKRGIHSFFIYCSLAKNVPVNEQMVPLLATLDAEKGDYGEQIQHHMQTPIFVDCVDGPQQLVEVTISDDSGSINNLLIGRTTLTLAVVDSA